MAADQSSLILDVDLPSPTFAPGLINPLNEQHYSLQLLPLVPYFCTFLSGKQQAVRTGLLNFPVIIRDNICNIFYHFLICLFTIIETVYQ
jgi:hypothetical protein